MIESPDVLEMLGVLPETEYPFPVGAAQQPEGIYCKHGVPVVSPHGTFIHDEVTLAPTLTELSGFSVFGVPQFRRGWYSTTALNRAGSALLTVSNVTSRPLAVMALVQAGQTFNFVAADKVAAPWTAYYQLTVMEKATLDSNPVAAYGSVGTNTGVYQVSPTIEAAHYWDGATSVQRSAFERKFGFLPLLMPGRSYVAESNIYVTEVPNNFAAAADTGTYTTGSIRFAMTAWTWFDSE